MVENTLAGSLHTVAGRCSARFFVFTLSLMKLSDALYGKLALKSLLVLVGPSFLQLQMAKHLHAESWVKLEWCLAQGEPGRVQIISV